MGMVSTGPWFDHPDPPRYGCLPAVERRTHITRKAGPRQGTGAADAEHCASVIDPPHTRAPAGGAGPRRCWAGGKASAVGKGGAERELRAVRRLASGSGSRHPQGGHQRKPPAAISTANPRRRQRRLASVHSQLVGGR